MINPASAMATPTPPTPTKSISIDEHHGVISKIRQDVLCMLDDTDVRKRVEAYFSECVRPDESHESVVSCPAVAEPKSTKLLRRDKYVGRKFYVTQHMSEFKKDNPESTRSEATKALVGKWKALTENTRHLYEVKASISRVLRDVDVDIKP